MTAILGLNAYHGDASAALVIDGELVAAAEEERFNRIKHCAGFPELAAAWCLETAGLDAEALDHIAVGRDPQANLDETLRRASLRGSSSPSLTAQLENAARVRNVRDRLATALGVDPAALQAELHHVEHHQAHVASAFFVSPFETAALLSVDGFGDFASTMLAEGRGSSIQVLERVLFPHSLGIFYTAVTQWLGFPNYGDEGKTMGLASYGKPRHLERMRELVRLDGPLFELGLGYFVHDEEGVDMTWDGQTPAIGRLYSERMLEVFGPARGPQGELTSEHEDVAASLQAMLEEAYLHLIRSLHARTGAENICLAGGVALNALANGRVRLETPFREIFIQPAASDSGTALGAAFSVWHQTLGHPRRFVMEHAYLGPEYSDEECAAAIGAAGLAGEYLADETLLPHVAARIAAGDVVGWFQGRMEFGPRALGNRSILVDPRRPEMMDVLNARIKFREPFRPFALSILAESTAEWFEQDYASPFMVLVYRTRADKRELIPAVNHVDDSGRLQTVDHRVSPRYWALIKEFERLTGVPVLLNTSFNENEPIVMTPDQAVETFRKARIDLLVLGNQVVRSDEAARSTIGQATASA